ncbi:hypothetical protein UJ101_01476 [Flavobacteriaceae bacterium UJ101]|nr:hypothetical protein UJ101_01476 [Flavobacteriaceae bacterium UJ101]
MKKIILYTITSLLFGLTHAQMSGINDNANQLLIADLTSHGSSNGVTIVDQQTDNDKNDATDGSNEYRTGLYSDNNIETGAQLQIDSTTKGLLIPRVTNKDNLDNFSDGKDKKGMIVYDNTTNAFYFYNGSSWIIIN